jgi:putative spermidine/putrescine transport system permease protein
MRSARSWLTPWLLLSPGLIVFLTLFLYPLLITVRTSLQAHQGGLSLVHYADFLGSRQGWLTIALSLFLACAATILAVLLSLPLVLALRAGVRTHRALRVATLVPLLIPGLISALGLYLVWDRWGWMNLLLVRFVPFVHEPIQVNFTLHGMILFYTWLFFPYVALTTLSVSESVGREVEEAAAISGANRWQTFRFILLPLLLPGVIGGSIFAFILSFGALSFPLILGGDHRMHILASRIYTYVGVFREWEAGSAMAVVMAAVQIVLIFLYLRLSRRWSSP